MTPEFEYGALMMREAAVKKNNLVTLRRIIPLATIEKALTERAKP